MSTLSFCTKFITAINAVLLVSFLVFVSACDSPVDAGADLLQAKGKLTAEPEMSMTGLSNTILNHAGHFTDSIKGKNAALIRGIYQKNGDSLLWSSNGSFVKETDSLLWLLKNAYSYGLFPSDYNEGKLRESRNGLQTSRAMAGETSPSHWTNFDIKATASFVQLVLDLKRGRLLPDSTVAKDSSLTADFFLQQKENFTSQPVNVFVQSLEPAIKDYHLLKAALRRFLPKANLKRFTPVKTKDSLLLPKSIYKRIAEEDSLKLKMLKDPDSIAISKAIAKYQKWKKLKADGKITTALISHLNATDREKFLRIAITLDRYKLLPPLPQAYLLVNLPAYYMEVREGDSVQLRSKIICGKPATQTPFITSAITDMITYPQWTIPESIIKNEILPGLQRDPGYTKRKGYSIIDNKGNEVNPYSVNWSRFKKFIPYRVIQGSGDDNALGVIKFNFSNPYAVYLHDTNQRYLFSRSFRAMSHGCVRVQQWKELSYYLLRRDEMLDSAKSTPIDSLNKWLAVKKKKMVRINQQLPLFIRYFTCEGQHGKLVLHDDIYEDDKRYRQTVFVSK